MKGKRTATRRSAAARIARLGCLLLALVVTGCASVPTAPPAEDQAAKAMTPPHDRALIYVYRITLADTMAGFDLSGSGQPIGPLDARRYYLLDVPPGPVLITAQVTPSTSRRARDLQVTVNAAAGQTYFVAAQVQLTGFYVLVMTFAYKLVEVSAAEGRDALNGVQLVKALRL